MINRKGFTLVETILVVVIVGISSLGLVVVMQQVLFNMHKPEVIMKATLLAEKEAERVLRNDFARAVNETLQSYTGNFLGYSRAVTVTNVDANNKIVTVRVYQGAIGSVWLTFLRTNYGS